MEKQTERTLPSSMELLEFFHAVEGERVRPDEPRLDPGIEGNGQVIEFGVGSESALMNGLDGQNLKSEVPYRVGAYIKLNCTCAWNASFVVVDEILEAENAELKAKLEGQWNAKS